MNGRMPVTKSLSFEWYDTPNIHFCTITDFVKLCESLGLTIEKSLYITEAGVSSNIVSNKHFANLFGQQGIFMLKS
jgi:methionine biosynthesis protein MetW